jgi:hypothetical protein
MKQPDAMQCGIGGKERNSIIHYSRRFRHFILHPFLYSTVIAITD